MTGLSPSAQRVQDLLDAIGLGHRVVEHQGSTRTSEEAAAAVGCSVAQIAKSLIFRARETGRPVLVVASGANRVDEKAVGRLIGERIERADPDFVREATGFAIGGVSPIGHAVPPLVLIDEDLMRLEVIWAAAGTPNAVFRLTPADLASMTGGRVATLRKA
ncbi:YbaK/EbsC family protein [Azospirillum picis]|uniref:Prolyl-tRNA editing enzyme YbaK/EbsC (Cys-tRNA(Pro) deacylase) n=1 Tax=Azospirillum picis TaxID=488438 RepID=A0ABU0MFS1_9PROT|nr:YbaK/EbsC family protein [Azospirillum picis]MBP2298663.1 prolyl-tRNA editing enzyme YbaK/EbsC (Cys-tRNA(Pro) deacylase) [Azospirillum picis]MDQ0532288.1 prolyl-tRNA editing enzyme YbaK/EbsC (Cys-tRNA(Pro) deacylase) [Azospirillum picis]